MRLCGNGGSHHYIRRYQIWNPILTCIAMTMTKCIPFCEKCKYGWPTSNSEGYMYVRLVTELELMKQVVCMYKV